MLLHQHLENHASTQPKFLFSEFERKTLTYKEANDLANQFANSLLNEGLVKGDRFTFLAKNCSEMAVMYYGSSKVGIVPVPLNYRLADKEWEYIINDSESKLIIVRGDEYVSRITDNKVNLEIEKKCFLQK